jgi:hypothetical protein
MVACDFRRLSRSDSSRSGRIVISAQPRLG